MENDSINDSNQQIPILGWCGIPASEQYSDVKYYQEMADAGFTYNFPWGLCHNPAYYDPYVKDLDVYLAALDAAEAVGMKILIAEGALFYFPEEDLRRIKEHPGLLGYAITDEPPASEFANLATIVKKIQAIDAVHPCYINLFPNYAGEKALGFSGPDAYRKHVRQYIEEVPVPMISFDHYCILMDAEKKRSIRPRYYENLEIIAEESRKVGKPFWAFALATAHGDYPVPTLSDLRLQVYSNLAYGAQCIQYFTWFDPWGNNPDDDAPVRIDGAKSPSYNTVQSMNKEIKALSKVFLNSKVLWTAHTGIIPQGCKSLNKKLLPKQIKSLEISDPGALVSMLEKGKDRFVVIVNHDINRDITVKVKGSPDLRTVNKAGEVDAVAEGEQILTPGDIIVLFSKK